jgi:hypothetical protein
LRTLAAVAETVAVNGWLWPDDLLGVGEIAVAIQPRPSLRSRIIGPVYFPLSRAGSKMN